VRVLIVPEKVKGVEEPSEGGTLEGTNEINDRLGNKGEEQGIHAGNLDVDGYWYADEELRGGE